MVAGLGCWTFGQAPETRPPESPRPPGKTHHKKPPGALPGAHKANPAPMSPEFDDVRRSIEALTPEQRQRFQDNLRRWAKLPPEEKKDLRAREEIRRQKMAEDIDNAIKEAGIELDKQQRQLFARRYAAERRCIEEQLRQETEQKRKPLLKEMLDRLKAEFSEPAAVTPPSVP
ncbi:MAG: DUF3106 domain-containing protein [Verrucomicrobiota bacterium]|nr:DUF3106 domain-containing protein [Verrucomicrobiota bacterium]